MPSERIRATSRASDAGKQGHRSGGVLPHGALPRWRRGLCWVLAFAMVLVPAIAQAARPLPSSPERGRAGDSVLGQRVPGSHGAARGAASVRPEAPLPSVDALFDDLEALEDPALESHRAGDLSVWELVLVIIFLIILFPVGIILLIWFLLDDEIDEDDDD